MRCGTSLAKDLLHRGQATASAVQDHSVDNDGENLRPVTRALDFSSRSSDLVCGLAARGSPAGLSGLTLTIGARRVAFARDSGSLVFLRAGIGRQDFWQLDPHNGSERQLTDLPASFVIGDFDVSPDGTEIVFDRVQESSSVVLIERAKESDTH